MSEDPMHKYIFTPIEAEQLQALHLVPTQHRALAMQKSLTDLSRDDLLCLFSQYIGVANSVVSNCHEAITFFRVLEGEENPERPCEGLNLPSIDGALNGVRINHNIDTSDCCETCVFVHGSMANQSPTTTDDVRYCSEDGKVFMCHDVGPDEIPNIPCKGWARRAALVNKEMLSHSKGEA